ncbi:hypothetical protein KAX97_02110 [candidate division WOR-3 bacterium]|nr:hypothetical protein [candidate division WOR-3 bacterium]
MNVNIPYFVPIFLAVFFYFTGQGDNIKITEISGPFSEICKKMDSRLGMEVGMIYETVIWFIWFFSPLEIENVLTPLEN